MNYSSIFLGWLGKIGNETTFANVEERLSSLASYYMENGTPGQKLVIGYDGRFFSREFAEHAATVMAEKGVKVFLSNQMAPSSILVTASIAKKGLGTLVFTGDEYDYRYLGMRAYDGHGAFLTDEDLSPFPGNVETSSNGGQFKRYVDSRLIELFDPSINYIHLLDELFETPPPVQSILIDPLLGSTQHFWERYLSGKTRGCSIHTNDTVTIGEVNDTTHAIQANLPSFQHSMSKLGGDSGIMISPDASRLEWFYRGHEGNVKKASLTDTVLQFVSFFSQQTASGSILLSDSLSFSEKELEKSPFEIKKVKDKTFNSEIIQQPYILAIDSFKRIRVLNSKPFDSLMAGLIIIHALQTHDSHIQKGGHSTHE